MTTEDGLCKLSPTMKIMALTMLFPLILMAGGFSQDAKPDALAVADHLQKISVTIKGEGSEGSGVLIERLIGKEKVAFVWTAAHVVAGLRSTREVVDSKTGTKRVVVEFKDAAIVRELVEDGRRVGEIEMTAKVVKYSDADDGEDLALLMVNKRNYAEASAEFYKEEGKLIVPISTRLLHVGSLMGQVGSNSMTAGVMSQIGRMIGKKEFDQTTVTAFPGSSGGGVYLEDGRYVGMLVRGAGEGFNLIVPIRRMRQWAGDAGIGWALDKDAAPPTIKAIEAMEIEDIGVTFRDKPKDDKKNALYPTLIHIPTK